MPAPTLQGAVAGTAGTIQDIPATRHSFMVRYRAPTGEILVGTFTVRLPSAEDYRQIAVALSNLARGVAWASIPPELQVVLLAMARCGVLVEDAPEWFRRPLDRLGAEVFLAVSQEAQRFEHEFFRAHRGPGEDDGQSLVVEIKPVGPQSPGLASGPAGPPGP